MKFTNMKLLRPCFLAVAAIMLFAGTASALDQVFTGTDVDMYLKQNTFPSGLNEYKVFLDAATSTTITGHVGSQTSLVLVNFSSTTDTLIAASGTSTIKAVDGSINNITITAPGYWFGDLIFSVNPLAKPTPLTVSATNQLGVLPDPESYGGWASQNDWVNGQNDILVLSKSVNLMQSVTINSPIGNDPKKDGLDQIKQIQISGLIDKATGQPPQLPEPATMLLLGLGLVGLAGISRRDKK